MIASYHKPYTTSEMKNNNEDINNDGNNNNYNDNNKNNNFSIRVTRKVERDKRQFFNLSKFFAMKKSLIKNVGKKMKVVNESQS